jgi:hypothetical protein
MAYVRQTTIVKVIFVEPHPLAGLTIRTQSASVREFTEFGLLLAHATQVEQAGTDMDKLHGLGDLLASLDEVRHKFAGKLIDWDMQEENGDPTPATLDGVMSLSDKEFYGIITEWLSAVGGVDAALGKDSGSGATVRELSELMEPLSPSQAS